jgi:hypothetical protein
LNPPEPASGAGELVGHQNGTLPPWRDPQRRARRLRAPDGPTPIAVETDAVGQPVAVRRRAWPRARAVARVQDRWRIDDEWWREQPIARLYHALLLDDGLFLVVYHDLAVDGWFEAGVHVRRLDPPPDEQS